MLVSLGAPLCTVLFEHTICCTAFVRLSITVLFYAEPYLSSHFLFDQPFKRLQVTNGTGLGRQLAGDSQATLPPGIAVASATLASLSAPHVSKHVSKRVLFTLASTSGIIGAGLMCIAGWRRSFALLCLSGAPQGLAYGISNLYRFFAVDTTLSENREKALAAVVGGAVLSAFMGPEAGRHLRTSLDQEFLGPFILSMCLWIAQVMALLADRILQCTCLVQLCLFVCRRETASEATERSGLPRSLC